MLQRLIYPASWTAINVVANRAILGAEIDNLGARVGAVGADLSLLSHGLKSDVKGLKNDYKCQHDDLLDVLTPRCIFSSNSSKDKVSWKTKHGYD